MPYPPPPPRRRKHHPATIFAGLVGVGVLGVGVGAWFVHDNHPYEPPATRPTVTAPTTTDRNVIHAGVFTAFAQSTSADQQNFCAAYRADAASVVSVFTNNFGEANRSAVRETLIDLYSKEC